MPLRCSAVSLLFILIGSLKWRWWHAVALCSQIIDIATAMAMDREILHNFSLVSMDCRVAERLKICIVVTLCIAFKWINRLWLIDIMWSIRLILFTTECGQFCNVVHDGEICHFLWKWILSICKMNIEHRALWMWNYLNEICVNLRSIKMRNNFSGKVIVACRPSATSHINIVFRCANLWFKQINCTATCNYTKLCAKSWIVSICCSFWNFHFAICKNHDQNKNGFLIVNKNAYHPRNIAFVVCNQTVCTNLF